MYDDRCNGCDYLRTYSWGGYYPSEVECDYHGPYDCVRDEGEEGEDEED
jgi:hypothetical protein